MSAYGRHYLHEIISARMKSEPRPYQFPERGA